MNKDQSAVRALPRAGALAATPQRLSRLCPEHDPLTLPAPRRQNHLRVNIAALGDVGASLLLGLRLLGALGVDLRLDRLLLGLVALGGGLVIPQPGDFRIQRLDAPGQRRVLGVKVGRALGHVHAGFQQVFRGSGAVDVLCGALDGVDHCAHLGRAALGLGQVGGQLIGVILGVPRSQNLLAAGKQRVVDGQRDLRQGGVGVLGVLELAVRVVDIGFQIGDFLFQLRDLFVQFGDGVPQLGRHVGFLGVQLGFARVQLGLGVVEFFQAVVDFLLVIVQFFFRVGQAVTDLDQQFVIHCVDFILVQRDLHRLFHKSCG